MKEYLFYEDIDVGGELLAFLGESGVITESAIGRIIAHADILTESKDPGMYTMNRHGVPKPIPWDLFKTVYTDFRKYPTLESVAEALGLNPYKDFEPVGEPDDRARETRRKENIRKAFNKAVEHFNSYGLGSLLEPKDRHNYSRDILDNLSDDEYDDVVNPHFDRRAPWKAKPTIGDIRPGVRAPKNVGRDGQIIDKINKEEDLLAGELYNNFTRIPKSHWGSWLKFWQRDYSQVKHDKSLFGRTWKKTFVLGYQIEKNVLFEIWFNSVNSTFSVHDIQGNEVSRRYVTMNEALKQMFNSVAQISPDDASFFHNANNPLSTSFLQSIRKGADDRMEILKKIEKRELDDMEKKNTAITVKEKEEREKAAARKAKLQATIKRNIENIRDEMKVSGLYGKAEKPDPDELRPKGRSNFEDELSRKRHERQTQASADADVEMQWRAKETAKEDARREKEAEEQRQARKQAIADARAKRDKEREEFEKKVKRDAARAAAKRAKDEGSYLQDDPHNRKIRQNPEGNDIFENTMFADFDAETASEVTNAVHDLTMDSSYESTIKQIKKFAENSAYTRTVFKDKIASNVIKQYQETRADEDFSRHILPRWLMKGRKAPIVLPTDKPSIFNRFKNAIFGTRYRADFIMGFSYNDNVNFEIWYVTEANPDKKWGIYLDKNEPETISTFYVFDITSAMLVRKYLPYYRNALQNVMAKISAF